MIDNIYNLKILEFSANIGHLGVLEQPDACAKKYTQLCGSTIHVTIKAKAGIIIDFAQQIQACILGQACASIVAQNIIGTSYEEVRTLKKQVESMLIEGTALPTSKFSDLACLYPAKDYKERHEAILLIFEALMECLEQLEQKPYKANSSSC